MLNKLMSNPKKGCDRIHHCAKQQYSSWFGSGMSSKANSNNRK